MLALLQAKAVPSDFEAEALPHRQQVRDDVRRLGGTRGAEFPSVWTEYKRALSEHPDRFQPCFWCEQTRSLRWELQVEHVRPKGAWERWVSPPPLVSDQPPPVLRQGDGYWWLAYTWSNYVLACANCNSRWKRSLFPLAGNLAPGGEGTERSEQPLLLLPTESFRSVDHFAWTVDGHMLPRSDRGAATIRVCGLNRGELVSDRKKVMRDIRRERDALLRALRGGDPRAMTCAVADLRLRCSRSAPYAGMCRWVIEQALGRPWEEIPGMPP